jgi:hypothetical protein
MRYLLTILLAGATLFNESAFSQTKLEAGIRIIPQVTAIRYTTGVGAKNDFFRTVFPGSAAPHYSRVRMAAGAGVVYYPLKRMRIGADLLYSLQGGGYEERRTNLNYFQVPVWIGFNGLPKRRVIFTAQAGFQLSCLAVARMKFSTGEKSHIAGSISRFSWGIPLAVGVKFKTGPATFLTAQVLVYSDFSTLSRTNKTLGAYNYIYPGLRICLDQPFSHFNKSSQP